MNHKKASELRLVRLKKIVRYINARPRKIQELAGKLKVSYAVIYEDLRILAKYHFKTEKKGLFVQRCKYASFNEKKYEKQVIQRYENKKQANSDMKKEWILKKVEYSDGVRISQLIAHKKDVCTSALNDLSEEGYRFFCKGRKVCKIAKTPPPLLTAKIEVFKKDFDRIREISNFVNHNEGVFSIPTIAKKLKLSDRQVLQAINDICKVGYAEKPNPLKDEFVQFFFSISQIEIKIPKDKTTTWVDLEKQKLIRQAKLKVVNGTADHNDIRFLRNL